MTATPPPFETASLICDSPGCEAEVIGSEIVQHPHDEDARKRALRMARRKACEQAAADGWVVARAGAKGPDLCPVCRP
jgi:hypothetical protein